MFANFLMISSWISFSSASELGLALSLLLFLTVTQMMIPKDRNSRGILNLEKSVTSLRVSYSQSSMWVMLRWASPRHICEIMQLFCIFRLMAILLGPLQPAKGKEKGVERLLVVLMAQLSWGVVRKSSCPAMKKVELGRIWNCLTGLQWEVSQNWQMVSSCCPQMYLRFAQSKSKDLMGLQGMRQVVLVMFLLILKKKSSSSVRTTILLLTFFTERMLRVVLIIFTKLPFFYSTSSSPAYLLAKTQCLVVE